MHRKWKLPCSLASTAVCIALCLRAMNRKWELSRNISHYPRCRRSSNVVYLTDVVFSADIFLLTQRKQSSPWSQVGTCLTARFLKDGPSTDTYVKHGKEELSTTAFGLAAGSMLNTL